MSGPPPSINKQVLAFCASINPSAKPVYLPIRPETGCEALDCFANVQKKLGKEGGRIQYGWEISVWPAVFIEAVHHAVYESPAGPPWLDITPPTKAEGNQERRLFLPDDSATYDFANPSVRRDNIRKALASDPMIEESLGLAAELAAIMNRIPGIGMVTVEGADAERVKFIAERSSYLRRQLALKYTPYDAPCFCGSRQRFKRCHGSYKRKSDEL